MAESPLAVRVRIAKQIASNFTRPDDWGPVMLVAQRSGEGAVVASMRRHEL